MRLIPLTLVLFVLCKIVDAQCQPVWSGVNMIPPSATALAVHDDDGFGSASPTLVVGEKLSGIGWRRPDAEIRPNPVWNAGRTDGHDWYQIGRLGQDPTIWTTGRNIETLFNCDEKSMPGMHGLYAGSSVLHWGDPRLKGVARWTGSEWVAVGSGIEIGYPFDGVVFDEDGSGPQQPVFIMVGGMSLTRNHPTITGVARWDGQSWTDVGGGLQPGVPGGVNTGFAVAVFDEDGEGERDPALFVGGGFAYAGTLRANNIARWNGQEWSTVGELGTNGAVRSLCVYDAGDGSMLYVGGSFPRVNGPSNWVNASRLARWDGQNWHTVPGWDPPGGGYISAMAVFDDDGPGPNRPALFVAGVFFGVDGRPASSIAKWDGQRWDTLHGGFGGTLQPVVYEMAVFDEDGDGPNPGGLYVTGVFERAGGVDAMCLARWGCPNWIPCLADCDFSTGFGVLDVFDFLCFLNRFHAGAPYSCDCDVSTGHGVCDIFDFLCFGQRFQRGCP